jgi:hypothetical protein
LGADMNVKITEITLFNKTDIDTGKVRYAAELNRTGKINSTVYIDTELFREVFEKISNSIINEEFNIE